MFPYSSKCSISWCFVACGYPFALLCTLTVCIESVQVEFQSQSLFLELLTLVVNVLVLVHFPVHVRVCVRVYICVDFRVDLGS